MPFNLFTLIKYIAREDQEKNFIFKKEGLYSSLINPIVPLFDSNEPIITQILIYLCFS
jgi:hypothetical protein